MATPVDEPNLDEDADTNEEEGENDDSNDADETQEQEASVEGETKLSKRKLRKMRKKENALKYRAEKRMRERANKKRRKRELREKGEDVGPSKKQLKRNTMANSSCKIRVVIDCGFDDLMSEKDIMQLTQQLSHSYSSNRRATDPLQFYVTSLGGKTKERMDKIGDYTNWDVNFTEKDYLSTFDKESLVYLSSESDSVLTTLDPEKVYVIGGLVDHNHHKGLCHKLAVEKGISHAQLPIGKYIELKSRRVLTINHVFEILLRYTESKNWEEAFFQVLPKRKGATCKPPRHAKHSSPPKSVNDTESENKCEKLEGEDVNSKDNSDKAEEVCESTEGLSTDCERGENKHTQPSEAIVRKAEDGVS